MCDDIEGSGTRGSLTLLSEHLLKGMHVFEPEASWAKLTRAANWVGPGGFVNCAIAPLDIAMWDARRRQSISGCTAPWRVSRPGTGLCRRQSLVQPVTG